VIEPTPPVYGIGRPIGIVIPSLSSLR
jgi:hypothetical protein